MAAAAEAEHGVAEQLDARERDEVAAALVEHVGDVLEVLRRLLDADDVRVRAPQAADGRRRDVDGGADRHVVDEQRQIGELARKLRIPVVEPLLLRPAVVRRDDERA